MTGESPTWPRAAVEPGPELDALLRRIEERVRGRELVSGEEVLALVACMRELLRDREALLEDIEALELGAAGGARRS